MIRYIIFAFIFFVATAQAASQDVNATISQNPVYTGQAFTLTVTANASLSSSEFDRSKLLHHGFIVGPTSTSRQINSINGQVTRQTQWVTTLLVRTPGDYIIPALSIAANQTQPIHFKAVAYHGQNKLQQKVQVQTQLLASSAWVGQSLLYKAKVLVATSLSNADFDPPTAENAKIKRIGKDQQQREIIDGVRYQTLTRYWLITPEKAGELTIKGPELSGSAGIVDPSFGMNQEPVDVIGASQKIRIQAIPHGFQQPWLGAQKVTIDDQLSPKNSNPKVGQAITRTITITAQGAGIAQLPKLKFNYPSGLRVYPEKPVDHLFIKDDHFYAQRRYTIAIIPTHSGKYTIKGPTLTWWNTHEETVQYSKIKPITLNVANVAGAPLSSDKNAPNQTLTASSASAAKSNSHQGHLWFWVWVVTCLIWVSRELLGYYLGKKSVPHQLKPQPDESNTEQSSSWHRFENAAKACQSKQAERALRQWLAHQDPLTQERLKPLLAELAAMAWHPDNSEEPWDGVSYLERINKTKRQAASTKHQKGELPPLNP
ncbi:BatD family protein [Celerinatantimonas diazotrophica]|uniref:Oxygen tolerance protein BatD n=1 Tax=Celerinatantimonas diazotrophica TaxID=412034 RepID=A0A4R1KIN5_9GAMM|nr:BatD family protein [Celerinatantimonas diazotrophica]TCK64023.1 oxygen tolerance protein BatD [Celerinatantimonas diazotrophica]CAG9297114.1 hypothetical protein CEDIAZO_02282 [Celerinatantimonas diazotrophica]